MAARGDAALVALDLRRGFARVAIFTVLGSRPNPSCGRKLSGVAVFWASFGARHGDTTRPVVVRGDIDEYAVDAALEVPCAAARAVSLASNELSRLVDGTRVLALES